MQPSQFLSPTCRLGCRSPGAKSGRPLPTRWAAIAKQEGSDPGVWYRLSGGTGHATFLDVCGGHAARVKTANTEFFPSRVDMIRRPSGLHPRFRPLLFLRIREKEKGSSCRDAGGFVVLLNRDIYPARPRRNCSFTDFCERVVLASRRCGKAIGSPSSRNPDIA